MEFTDAEANSKEEALKEVAKQLSVSQSTHVYFIYVYTWSVIWYYSGTSVQWSLCKTATSLLQPPSAIPK